MSEQYRPVSQAYLIKALRQAEAELARVTAERDATLRALEAELVTVRNEKHTALRERDHWITRLHVEQEKHTDTDAARTRWLFKAAELERERDAYKGAIHAMIWDSTLPNLIAHYRTRATLNFHQPIGEKFRTIIARLEAIRDLGVAPQPSGNSGGFAAAAGILADTWDGEKSEDAIRRMRDGTPPVDAEDEGGGP